MDTLQQIPLTLSLANTNSVAGTTNTFTTTVASVPVIAGKFGTALGVLTNSATTPTVDVNTGAAFAPILPNTCAAIVFGTNAAGTLVAAQGAALPTEVGVTTTVGAFINAPQFPSIPDDFCPFSYTIVRVAPSGGTGFVLGTTSWAASSMTCSAFKNVCTLPARPQIA